MTASAWFSRRLESICDVLNLQPSLLSLLGALGANIPNYAASTVAIVGGHLDVGLGIIIGSNIYNIAIILSIATFATPKRHGIALTVKEAQDARVVAGFTLAIMLTILLEMWLLPGTPLVISLHLPLLTGTLSLVIILLTLCLFAALAFHALTSRRGGGGEVERWGRLRRPGERGASLNPTGQAHRPRPAPLSKTFGTTRPAQASSPPPHDSPSPAISRQPISEEVSHEPLRGTYNRVILRWIGEGLLALVLSLAGVVVMVQSGQTLANDLHIPQVLAGLLVLAVATSLPNTVVAFSLARTDRETACVEEIFSSNSINASLGIALPLLFWHYILHDRLLLLLDAPLMLLLTLAALLLVLRRRVSRADALLLLLVYATWVVIHMFV